MDLQQTTPSRSDDDTRIRAVALDYIAGVLENDPARMKRSLHPTLAKRAYLPGLDGKPQLSKMSAVELIQRVGAPGRPLDPSRHAEVVILDRFGGAASVRTTFDTWIDYLHIVNVGHEWKIINVLWELTADEWVAKGGVPTERMR